MSKDVRNFWIEVKIDGYKNPITFGPKKKEEGFHMVINQRNEGRATIGAIIKGYVTERKIVLTIESGQEPNSMVVITKR